MHRMRTGLIMLVLVALGSPAVVASASTAAGASMAEFVVTGKRPPQQRAAAPPAVHYAPHDWLPGISDTRQLPRTGERPNYGLVILGGVVLGGLGVAAMVRRGDREG